MMKEVWLEGPRDYKLMSQTGLRQYVFPLDSMHNAIWDTAIIDGTLYFSLSTELSTAGYTRLYRYDYDTNSVRELFKVEDVIMPSERAIRASKFHTSIHKMNDGRFVMTTHTTDRSPNHPTWMPIPYVHHLWEGYAGSNIVIYDPASGKAENLGIPVPHETIYGATYDGRHNALFFTGGFRGHLYRYGFDDHSLRDFGQISENWSFRLVWGPDGKIYNASRSGYMYRINTDTLELEDLNYRVPFHTYPQYEADYKGLAHGRIGPDGRLYFCFFYSRRFVAFDCKTDAFEDMGDYLPAVRHNRDESRHGVYGWDFDSEGVLWYAVFSRNCDSGVREIGMPSSLFRWDIARGGKPEWMGIIGTKERAACWTSEICIRDDDIMYIIGSNHANDGPDITAVDLKAYRGDMRNFGDLLTEDPYYAKPTTARYDKAADEFLERLEFGAQNDWHVPYELAHKPVRLWRALAPDRIDDSPVKAMAWEDARTLLVQCAGGQMFRIADGKPTPADNAPLPAADLPGDYAGLPHYPGRQYKAIPTAAAALSGGRTLVGTLDGMLAVCGPEGIFGLGPAAYNGPVRSLSAAPDGSFAYGVAGDDEDIGILFRYDDKAGLRWLGHVAYEAPAEFSGVNCPILSACAVSPDGKILAVGGGDRLATLMFYAIS